MTVEFNNSGNSIHNISPQARDIIKKGAERVFNLPASWKDEFEESGFLGGPTMPAEENPVILAASRRSNLAGLLHWASANIQYPGEPVPYYVNPDMESIAKELVRRGQQDVLLNSARSMQNAAWKLCMRVGFELTDDVLLLKEMFDICFHSICDFVDGNYRIISKIVEKEKDLSLVGMQLEKLDLVKRILEGRQIHETQASLRFNYELAKNHLGIIVWNEKESPETKHLEELANAISKHLSRNPPLIIIVNSSTLWGWISHEQMIDNKIVERELRRYPGIKIAIGSPRKGIDGFRDTHLEAVDVQRLLGRINSKANYANIEQVRLLMLLTKDQEAASQFVNQTLGNFARENKILQKTLRTYLYCGCNAVETGKKLNIHRNTLLRRIEKAKTLLPRPLEESVLNVSTALELLAW